MIASIASLCMSIFSWFNILTFSKIKCICEVGNYCTFENFHVLMVDHIPTFYEDKNKILLLNVNDCK